MAKKKISREDAVCTIGYDGSAALVDRFSRKSIGKLSFSEMLEKGYYRAAAASAFYSDSEEEMKQVASAYNKASGSSYQAEAIPRLFGVAKVHAPRILVL